MPALQYLASFSQVKGVILILQVRKLRFWGGGCGRPVGLCKAIHPKSIRTRIRTRATKPMALTQVQVTNKKSL